MFLCDTAVDKATIVHGQRSEGCRQRSLSRKPMPRYIFGAYAVSAFVGSADTMSWLYHVGAGLGGSTAQRLGRLRVFT